MEFLLMQILPDWAPNIHPMLVHFPIAILSIAIFFDFVSFFLPREKKWWTEEATAFLYGVGAIAAIIIYYTGTLAADSVNASAAAEAVMGEHKNWAWWTIWFYGIYAIARIIATWWTGKKHRLKFHVGFFLLSFIGMYFLYQTGDHGAKMVFGYGTGTGQLVEQPTQVKESSSAGYQSGENGTVNWRVGADAANVLREHFTFLRGEANAAVGSKEDTRLVQFQNPNLFFVTNGDSYSSMQMVLTVHPETYEGDIILAHHVEDTDNYGYLALHPDGSAELGRVENGQKSIVEEGSFEWQGMERLKLSVSGDHLKGYVNGTQIVHGHSEQPGPGAVGLRLNGNGTLGLGSMKITPVPGEEHSEEETHQH